MNNCILLPHKSHWFINSPFESSDSFTGSSSSLCLAVRTLCLSLAHSPSFFLWLAINELPHAQKMIRMQTKTRHNPKCDRKFVFIVYNFCVFNRNRRSPWHLVKWCLFGCVQTGNAKQAKMTEKEKKTNAIRMEIAWITVVHTFLGDFFFYFLPVATKMMNNIELLLMSSGIFLFSLFFHFYLNTLHEW